MSDLIDTITRVILKPESPTEVIAHEVIEFFVYGNLYKILEDHLLEDEDEE